MKKWLFGIPLGVLLLLVIVNVREARAERAAKRRGR